MTTWDEKARKDWHAPLMIPIGPAVAAVLFWLGSRRRRVQTRPVRTVVVQARRLMMIRQVVGEIKPRYESELSFRVAGKVLGAAVDVGLTVKQVDILARLEHAGLRKPLAIGRSGGRLGEVMLVEAQATEFAIQSKLSKGRLDAKAIIYFCVRLDVSPRLGSTPAKANLDVSCTSAARHRAQSRVRWRITELLQVLSLARMSRAGDDREACPVLRQRWWIFNIAETVFASVVLRSPRPPPPLSNPDLKIEGQVREISRIADASTRTYTVKVTLKTCWPSCGSASAGWACAETSAASVVQATAWAWSRKEGRPAAWAGPTGLQAAGVAAGHGRRYETESVIIASGTRRW